MDFCKIFFFNVFFFKVTKGTAKSYQGYYKTTAMAYNWPNSKISFFLLEGQKRPWLKAKATTVLGPDSYHWGLCYQQGLPCLVFASL